VSWFSEHFAELLLGAIMSVMGWLGIRAVDRLDKMEEKKADKEDLASLIKHLERHIDDDRELRREVSRKFDEFGESLSEVRVNVAQIRGRLERP
jgi:phage shock protein A